MSMMARASSGLAYPERFYAAASYAGFDGSPNSSVEGVTSKFSNDSALLLYALYQQVPLTFRFPLFFSIVTGSRSEFICWSQFLTTWQLLLFFDESVGANCLWIAIIGSEFCYFCTFKVTLVYNSCNLHRSTLTNLSSGCENTGSVFCLAYKRKYRNKRLLTPTVRFLKCVKSTIAIIIMKSMCGFDGMRTCWYMNGHL